MNELHDDRSALAAVRVTCADCTLFQICLPIGLNDSDLALLDSIITRRRPLRRGQSLFRAGGAFHAVYVVRSGSIKSFITGGDGMEQVTGFHLPGELVGLDAIAGGHHACSAEALETASFCEIPFTRLEALAADVRGLSRQLLRVLGRELAHDRRAMAVLGRPSGEQRLAALLVNLLSRLEARGFSARELYLSMSRQDIASYLGLATETISRLFTQFQAQGLLQAQRRHVTIRDPQRLKALAGLDLR